jgi:hypothetical protein
MAVLRNASFFLRSLPPFFSFGAADGSIGTTSVLPIGDDPPPRGERRAALGGGGVIAIIGGRAGGDADEGELEKGELL